jgi:hypothetical protein
LFFSESKAQSTKASYRAGADTIVVLGKVTDCETDAPLGDAYVKYDYYDYDLKKPVFGVEKYTDEWGYFLWIFSSEDLNETIYYNLTKTGYESKKGEVILKTGVRLDICLSRIPAMSKEQIVLEGTVRDSGLSALGGVLLTYSSVDGTVKNEVKTAITDSSGSYRVVLIN